MRNQPRILKLVAARAVSAVPTIVGRLSKHASQTYHQSEVLINLNPMIQPILSAPNTHWTSRTTIA